MRSTEVADRPFPDGTFFGRDIGDRGRYLRESLVEEIPFLNCHLAHLDTRKRAVEQMDGLPKGT